MQKGDLKTLRDMYGAQCFYVQFHRKRFEILHNFFIEYNKLAGNYNFLTNEPEGYCGVIQLFNVLIRKKMTMEKFFTAAEVYQADAIIGPFMNGLRSELSSNYLNEQK